MQKNEEREEKKRRKEISGGNDVFLAEEAVVIFPKISEPEKPVAVLAKTVNFREGKKNQTNFFFLLFMQKSEATSIIKKNCCFSLFCCKETRTFLSVHTLRVSLQQNFFSRTFLCTMMNETDDTEIKINKGTTKDRGLTNPMRRVFLSLLVVSLFCMNNRKK
jgi:hypothetical protein